MPTRWERILAAIEDKVGWDSRDGSESSSTREYFHSNKGRKIAIVGADGKVRYLGNSLAVVHEHDSGGKLLSRRRVVDTLQEGERLERGSFAAYQAWNAQHLPHIGMMD